MSRLLCVCLAGLLALSLVVPSNLRAMELTEGFAGIPYGASCAESFAGDDWKDAQIAPIWNDETRELRLTYDPELVGASDFVMLSRVHETLDYDGFSLITVLYLCEKAADRFAGIVATFSVLNTRTLDDKLHARFGEPDEVTAVYSLWDRPEYFIQLNLNELIVYTKRTAP